MTSAEQTRVDDTGADAEPNSEQPLPQGDGHDGHDDHNPVVTDRNWYSRRQVFAASFAFLILGVGAGMAYTTKTFIDTRRRRDRPSRTDVGFVHDMLDHHDQAVEMSLITLVRPGIRGNTRQFATEVILFQRYEIGLLEGRLNAWGLDRGDEDRTAMAWMDMATTVNTMPDMASADDLQRLKTSTGIDADREFLTLMRAHHQGGLHMATYARDHATDSEVITIASRMAYNQNLEITEYTRTLNALPNE